MLVKDLINIFSDLFQNKLDDNVLDKLQEYLLKAEIFILPLHVLSMLFLSMLFLSMLFLIIFFIFSLDLIIAIMLGILIPPFALILLIFVKSEKRANEIKNEIPDFLRQLSSMLRVGLSLENALVDLSKYGSGPLYNELGRVVIEIRMGKGFDESFYNMANRLSSDDLERSFKIILTAHKSGGGLSDIIGDVSDDLRAMLALERERKASVMMSTMFLVLASIVAAPFALGMVCVYSTFIIGLGKGSGICNVAPIAAEIYLIIHSISAGFLIALIMFGDFKKGFRYAIILTISAFTVFYFVNTFALSFFSF